MDLTGFIQCRDAHVALCGFFALHQGYKAAKKLVDHPYVGVKFSGVEVSIMWLLGYPNLVWGQGQEKSVAWTFLWTHQSVCHIDLLGLLSAEVMRSGFMGVWLVIELPLYYTIPEL